MSSKNTIALTQDNEHIYSDCNEPRFDKGGNYIDDDIIIEFDKKNIDILIDDDENLIIQLKAGTQIHTLIKHIGK